tara:strand:- start:1387 stop:1581 length:195 start_codon:yes stop_codon:yes gene_type:complete
MEFLFTWQFYIALGFVIALYISSYRDGFADGVTQGVEKCIDELQSQGLIDVDPRGEIVRKFNSD